MASNFATKRLSKELTKVCLLFHTTLLALKAELTSAIYPWQFTTWDQSRICGRFSRMVPRYQGPRRKPIIHEQNLFAQICFQSFISHRSAPREDPLALQADETLEPPEVTFVLKPDRPIPVHPHIYSNGIICLDLLGTQGWSPVQNVESICMSLQSMLTGNTKNERPEGDASFVATNRRRPRDIDFYYHDNTV